MIYTRRALNSCSMNLALKDSQNGLKMKSTLSLPIALCVMRISHFSQPVFVQLICCPLHKILQNIFHRCSPWKYGAALPLMYRYAFCMNVRGKGLTSFVKRCPMFFCKCLFVALTQ